MERRKAKSVVVDAVAFFKNVQLQNFAENVYTVRPVVSEIRDSKTRQRLAVLPYQLQFREPSTESIQHVSEFARKTGDYQSLSAVDIQVMALTYQLTKQAMGTEHLKEDPEVKRTYSSSNRPLEKNTDIVGFYIPSKGKARPETGEGDVSLDLTELTVNDEDGERAEIDGSVSHPETVEVATETKTGDVKEDRECDGPRKLLDGVENVESQQTKVIAHLTEAESVTVGDKLDQNAYDGSHVRQDTEPSKNIDDHPRTIEEISVDDQGDPGVEEEGEDDDDGGDDDATDDDDDDDDVGWITPQNLQKAKQKMATDIKDSLEGVKVACLTSDFAMQNVLIQMGIPVVSVEGMLIKRAKSYALRCFACFKVTSDTSRAFCPKCGNATLHKVTVSVDEEGNTHYHMSKRRRYRVGELRQSLPMPRGGKHADNPIVCEDQPKPQERLSRKAMMRNNVFDPDYIAQNSPFVTRDVTSRSAMLGVARKKQQNRRGRRK